MFIGEILIPYKSASGKHLHTQRYMILGLHSHECHSSNRKTSWSSLGFTLKAHFPAVKKFTFDFKIWVHIKSFLLFTVIKADMLLMRSTKIIQFLKHLSGSAY